MRRWTRLGALAGVLALSPAFPVAAQETVIQRLGLDRLRLTSLGIVAGPVWPAGVVSTQAYGFQADYGEIASRLHVVFTIGYWGSHFTDQKVDGFIRQLQTQIVDPDSNYTILRDRVRVSDIALEAEMRYILAPHSVIAPYVGGGFGVHAVNAQSKLIDNTFLESALDNIGTGLSGIVGLDLLPRSRVSIGVQARYTLLSTVHYASIRGMVSYRIAPRRPPASPPK